MAFWGRSSTAEPTLQDDNITDQEALNELGSRLNAAEAAESAAPDPEPAASIERGDVDADDGPGVDGWAEVDDASIADPPTDDAPAQALERQDQQRASNTQQPPTPADDVDDVDVVGRVDKNAADVGLDATDGDSGDGELDHNEPDDGDAGDQNAAGWNGPILPPPDPWGSGYPDWMGGGSAEPPDAVADVMAWAYGGNAPEPDSEAPRVRRQPAPPPPPSADDDDYDGDRPGQYLEPGQYGRRRDRVSQKAPRQTPPSPPPPPPRPSRRQHSYVGVRSAHRRSGR